MSLAKGALPRAPFASESKVLWGSEARMLRYLARRIVLMFVALFIICTATFFLMQFLPGSPLNDEKLSDEQRAQLEAKYGLDQPLIVRYAVYMGNLARGDLGDPFYYEGRPVLEILVDRLPISAFIG